MSKTTSRIIKKETEGFTPINEELGVYAYNFNGEKTENNNYDTMIIKYSNTKNCYLLVNINKKDFFFYKNITVDYLEASEKVKNKMKLELADDVVNVLEIFDEYLKDKFKKKLKTLIRKSIKNEINNEIPAFKEQINNYLKLIS